MGKVASKIFGLYPFNSVFRHERDERWPYSRATCCRMSTSLQGRTTNQWPERRRLGDGEIRTLAGAGRTFSSELTASRTTCSLSHYTNR